MPGRPLCDVLVLSGSGGPSDAHAAVVPRALEFLYSALSHDVAGRESSIVDPHGGSVVFGHRNAPSSNDSSYSTSSTAGGRGGGAEHTTTTTMAMASTVFRAADVQGQLGIPCPVHAGTGKAPTEPPSPEA